MKEDESIESRVQQAMRSRIQHFRDLADSLTFEGVRRLLEKDLALDTHALDKHKKFVKQLLEKLLSSTEEDEQIKPEEVKKEDEEQKPTDNDDEEKIEDSPVMGLLSVNKSTKSENPKTLKDKIPTEDMIKKAIWKRAKHFRSNSEELTIASVRRLIEEDLGLEKFSLDPFKKLISKQLDEVLNSQNDPPNKPDADSSHSESEVEEVEIKPKKKPTPKTKVQKSEAPKKRKKPAQETEQPKKKKMKNIEETSAKKKKVKVADVDSSGEKSDSSAEKSEKKEMVVAPVYGKKVERLKSVIKACGMTVAPTVYRKAKQVSEGKREAFLLKELEEILSKEGLSANPSEKEIKEVKRRKEKAKELEGIDTSNIVTGSRRRSTFNFVPPPKPKAPIEDESEESDDDDDGDDDSEDTDNENIDGDGDGDDQEGDDKDGDEKDGGDDENEGDDDDKDGGDDKEGDDDDDDKDEDDKVDESKSEEVAVNDEIV